MEEPLQTQQRSKKDVLFSSCVGVYFPPPLLPSPICISIDPSMQSWNCFAFLHVSAPSLSLSSVRWAGGLRSVIASRYPCTSSAVWTPGLWTGLGPASFENGPGAWCQTSWQTCSCRSDAGQSGPGRPSETPGSSGVGKEGWGLKGRGGGVRKQERKEKEWRRKKDGRKEEHWEREWKRQTNWIMHHQLFWPFRASCNYSWVFFIFIEMPYCNKHISIQSYKWLMYFSPNG